MFKTIVESIFLRESLKSAKEFAQNQSIPQQVFDELNKVDITATKKLIHQFLKWYVTDTTVSVNDEFMKDVNTFIKFSGTRIKEPIEKFKTYEEFKKFIEPFLNIQTKAQKKDELEGQYKKIFENDKMLVVLPYTHTASCKYGGGTTWCTTAKEAAMFNMYIGRGCTIYYIIDKNNTDPQDPMHKMSWVIESNGYVSQYVDALNHMKPAEIKKWITDNGGNLDMFTIRVDKEERDAAKLKELSSKIETVYKPMTKLTLGYDMDLNLYKLICNSHGVDKVFINLKELTLTNVTQTSAQSLPIPASVEKINLGNYCDFTDLEFMNRDGITFFATFQDGNCRPRYTNCDKISLNATLRGYADYVWSNREKLAKMITSSGFKAIVIDANDLTEYGGYKDKALTYLNGIINSTPTASTKKVFYKDARGRFTRKPPISNQEI